MGSIETIREALAPHALAAVPEDENASLFDLGVIDSFGLTEVIAELEGRFGVKVPDAELVPKHFETIAKMVAYFDARKSA